MRATRTFVWVLAVNALACSSGDGMTGPSGSGGRGGVGASGGAGGTAAGGMGGAAAGDGGAGMGGGPGGRGGATGGGGSGATFSWASGRACPIARFEASGAVVGVELWVMGGFTTSGLEVTRRIDVYDPEADSWRRGPDLPGAETHLAVVTIGDDVIIAGGFPGAFSAGIPLPTADVWRYRAATSSWAPGPTLPRAGAAFAWALLGTSLHLAGGLGPDGTSDADTHHVWDTAGAATWTSAAGVPNPRNHGGGAAAGGLLYAIAGRHGWDEVAGAVADVNAFDPAAGTWATRAPLPSARSEIGASTSTLADGRILVIGGSLAGIVPSADVFVYDPNANAWSSLPPLPEPRKGAVALQLGRRIVVTTGSPTSTDPVDTTFIGCCL